MKVLLLVQLLFHIFLETDACAELRLTSEDNSVVVGRSMEWSMDLLSHFIVEPKGKQHIATLKQGCIPVQGRLKWTNLYDVAYLDAWQSLYATDGMNSAGLSVGSLFLPKFTEYQHVPQEKCSEALSQLEFPLWLLGNFKTVEEVRKSLSLESFPLVYGGYFQGFLFEQHFSVMDKTGDGIVIEYTRQGRQVHNNTLGVLTNAPPYDFHMLNIRNYIELSNYNREPLVLGQDEFPPLGEGSGLLGMPGDLTPPSRFVRLAVLKEFATRPKSSAEAVYLAFHVLESIDIPHGVLSKKESSDADFTVWKVAKDLTNNAFYFRDYNDTTIQVVYLNKVHPEQVLFMKAYTDQPVFRDVTDRLKAHALKESGPRQDEL